MFTSLVFEGKSKVKKQPQVSMLTAPHFERIVSMWKYADQLPCMILLGDFWQLPVVDPEAKSCEKSAAWVTTVKVIPFLEQVRCKDPNLQKKLNILRTAQPSMKQLKKMLRGHRAWKTNDPTAYDILELFRKHADTTVLTCSRAACAKANELAMEAFFEHQHKKPLGQGLFDYEANLENYDEKNKLKDGQLRGAPSQIYQDMRVYLTKNVDKEHGFVNGMAATVVEYDEASKCLLVKTRLGQLLAVHMVCNELQDGRRVSCFPVRIGYACTIPKVQGMTLPHVTIWLDSICCRAAAYVAMSRVAADDDYLIAGAVTPKHFVPAQ